MRRYAGWRIDQQPGRRDLAEQVLGRHAIVYPNVFWRGILPPGHIAKNRAEIEVVARRM